MSWRNIFEFENTFMIITKFGKIFDTQQQFKVQQ